MQNIGLKVGYKENEQVQPTYRMCAALVLPPINTVEEGWLMITENVPQNEKFILFLYYLVELKMECENVAINT